MLLMETTVVDYIHEEIITDCSGEEIVTDCSEEVNSNQSDSGCDVTDSADIHVDTAIAIDAINDATDDTVSTDGSNSCANSHTQDSTDDHIIDSTSVSFVCKWTHCDWPGSYDDLVDHIREIHVQLQPYQQQRHNWRELKCNKSGHKSTTSDKSDNYSLKTQHYVCLWEGCKVYGKASLSRNWLERHVLEQHSGPRPFKCIVEGCGQRFKVQSALERHVNSHFKPVEYASSNWSSDGCCTSCCPANASAAQVSKQSCCAAPSSSDISSSNSSNCVHSIQQKLTPFELHIQQTSRATMSAGAATASSVNCKSSSLDSNNNNTCHHYSASINGSNGTPNKILKRRKSATRLKRKCFYVKCSEDFFDESVMERVRYGLIQLNRKTGLDINGNQPTITFHSKVIARRENDSGEVNVLLNWEPNNILPDVWVSEKQASKMKSKSVPMSTIPPHSLEQLIEETNGFEKKPKIKQRRK
ncbi:zinc finger protein AEBP2-like [Oppia nitens]|uniref:zinc finger protein AEBP2-like n=1 Tax=Oppia nitens TaxID=1686743 RepID=UPI0023DC6194|nr:zinc finger protein AEBP2-like [Oppia nitens]